MLEHDHSPEAIAERIDAGPNQSYLRDWVYGGIDGAVTTFAIVAGTAGADLGTKTILILGVANLVADGFSMAAGNYLGTKASRDEMLYLEAIENEEIDRIPSGEKEEVRQLLQRKGLEGDVLEKAVDLITSDRQKWVQLMLTEEHGLPLVCPSPWKAAWSTWNAFLICGTIPLLPYLFGFPFQGGFALGLTALVFFLIGSLKSKWSITPWWKSGSITLLVGLFAAVIAYGIGAFLKHLG